MDIAICIAVKNRSNIIVKQEDPVETYKHVASLIKESPCIEHFPPTLNRDTSITLNLLPKLLMSLRMVKTENDNWTIIIVDYESTDVNVPQIAHQILDGHIQFVVEKHAGKFSRGSGLHLAAEIAKQRGHSSLFFCDADMYFTDHDIFDQAKQALDQDKVYFPICFSFTQVDHLKGFWRDTGYGMMFIKTKTYFSIKGWQHNISWGEEDNLMHANFKANQIIRSRAIGYFHQWHPNSIVFKTLEYPVKFYVGKAAVQKS